MFEIFQVILSFEGGNSVENDETKKVRNILNLTGRKISSELKVLSPISIIYTLKSGRSK